MPPVTVVTSGELAASWQWLRRTASGRPIAYPAGATHLRDDKKFQCSTPPGPLGLGPGAPECVWLGRLYLASLSVPTRLLNGMAAGAPAPDVQMATPLDPTVGGVLKKKTRFRAGFAEHLAFWLRLSDASHGAPGTFALARPNLQPEDKGHDGLSLELQPPRVELQSVKNSIGKAKPLVSTGHFRKSGTPTHGALLDDFWLLQHESVGLQRLQNMIEDVSGSLGLPPGALPGALAHQAVVGHCAFNGVVVSHASQGTADLFDGYEHITQVALGRVATFVGAVDWGSTAAAVQSATLGILSAEGLV